MKSVDFDNYSFLVPASERISVRGTLDAGEVLHLGGPSGIGKSTFLRSVAGLSPQAEGGSLKILGKEVIGESPVAREISVVFQGFQLFAHLSVFENLLIAFESRPALRALSRDLKLSRIKKILSSLGLEERVHDLASSLSGGEHQRVAIARALLSEAKVLLFDEPFSALDGAMIGVTVDLIRAYLERHRATLIVVSHRPEDFTPLGARSLDWKVGQTCLEF